MMDKELLKYLNRRVNSLKQQCNNKCYWSKDVKVCFTAKQLLNWLKKHNINPKGLAVRRIDCDGNYSLDNIEFLTPAEHSKRHRTTGYCKTCNRRLESYNRRRGYCSDKCAREAKKVRKNLKCT